MAYYKNGELIEHTFAPDEEPPLFGERDPAHVVHNESWTFSVEELDLGDGTGPEGSGPKSKARKSAQEWLRRAREAGVDMPWNKTVDIILKSCDNRAHREHNTKLCLLLSREVTAARAAARREANAEAREARAKAKWEAGAADRAKAAAQRRQNFIDKYHTTPEAVVWPRRGQQWRHREKGFHVVIQDRTGDGGRRIHWLSTDAEDGMVTWAKPTLDSFMSEFEYFPDEQ